MNIAFLVLALLPSLLLIAYQRRQLVAQRKLAKRLTTQLNKQEKVISKLIQGEAPQRTSRLEQEYTLVKN